AARVAPAAQAARARARGAGARRRFGELRDARARRVVRRRVSSAERRQPHPRHAASPACARRERSRASGAHRLARAARAIARVGVGLRARPGALHADRAHVMITETVRWANSLGLDLRNKPRWRMELQLLTTGELATGILPDRAP